jgi:hypothetical protein
MNGHEAGHAKGAEDADMPALQALPRDELAPASRVTWDISTPRCSRGPFGESVRAGDRRRPPLLR